MRIFGGIHVARAHDIYCENTRGGKRNRGVNGKVQTIGADRHENTGSDASAGHSVLLAADDGVAAGG